LASWLFVLREIRERERRKCIFPKRSDIAISIAFPFEREMGIWGYVCSTSESLKWNTPDLTAVKGWCSKINNVRMNATQTLSQYMSDEETRSRIGQFAVDLAKNAAFYGCREGLKSVPGI
jgi:hypothetical protein